MKNMKRVIKNGFPAYLAPWYKDLTANGKSLIGQTKIMATYSPRLRDHLTKMEYKPRMTAEQFEQLHADYSRYFAIAAE